MIDLNNINVIFNHGTILENPVLKGVSLLVEKGQFLTVIGSNGAGKSTLLGAVTGETPIIQGNVVLNGLDDQTSGSSKSKAVREIFQDPLAGTCAELSIEENMALAYMRGCGGWASAHLAKGVNFPRANKYSGLGLKTDWAIALVYSLRAAQAVSLVMATLADSKICSLMSTPLHLTLEWRCLLSN